MRIKEQIYILYRRVKAFAGGLAFMLCRIYPVDRQLISVCTFEGKGGFGCNPKYLVQALHKKDPEIRFVWFVNDMEKEFPSYIKKVPNTLWSRACWLSRSKVWIDNYRKPYGTKKRKGQYYLNVNHYTLAIKCTGLLRGTGFSKMAYLVSKNDSDMMDGLVIDSKWCEDCFDQAMVFDGPMLKTGAPRCDILYGDRTLQKEAFRKKHDLPDDAKVIMFAPTFREGAKNGKRYVFSEVWTIDFERLIHNLENKFGGKWYICIRVHPQLAATFKQYHNEAVDDRLLDESLADDMYELMAGMDAYLTDYSSALFEAGFAHIPAFIYADDIDTYVKARGALMWTFDKDYRKRVPVNKAILPEIDAYLPYTVASNNDELEEDIRSFDMDKYNEKLDDFHSKAGLLFDGRAGERLSDMLMLEMKK